MTPALSLCLAPRRAEAWTPCPLPSLIPFWPLLAQVGRFASPGSFGTFLRATGYRLRLPRPAPFAFAVRHCQDALLARGAAGPHQRAALLHETRSGPVPTVMLGGFVPDATEAVFLLRRTLLRFGSLYCFNYPRHGISSELLFAQLDDLVDKLSLLHGRPPVILAISFGAGLIIPWLKRTQALSRARSRRRDQAHREIAHYLSENV